MQVHTNLDLHYYTKEINCSSALWSEVRKSKALVYIITTVIQMNINIIKNPS